MTVKQAIAMFCSVLLIAQRPYTFAQSAPSGTAPPGVTANAFSPEQLDSLVAPVALYPDPILSQLLVAATYPLEIVEAGRWLAKNQNLKGQALADAVKKQSWDASIQAMVLMPDVLKRMDQDVSWTSDLGNAFLAQQADVMQAIQRMRQKASNAGALQSTPQQTVSTASENGQTYVVIEPANPEIVYVPQYNPADVWGPPPEYYPYPPIYYPTGGAIAAGAISFGVGMAIGAIWGGGWSGWGWRCGWGGNNVYVNHNFISNNHFNRANVGDGNRWVHNPAHRGGVPYTNRDLANRFQGGGPSMANRPAAGKLQQGLNQPPGHRGGGSANQPGQGNPGPRGAGERIGQGGTAQRGAASDRIAPVNAGNRGGSSSQGSASRLDQQSGADRIGNRELGGAGAGKGAFGGIDQGGGRTRMNDSRGSRSFGSGGMQRGGFGGGGGFRGGGRRR